MDYKFSENFFSLYLNLDVTKKSENYQIVYASQLYGTFFGVGAKIDLTDDCSTITGIHLALNNYKGLYNIGILNHTANTWRIEDKVGIIVLHLKAYNGLNNGELVKKISLNLSDEIPVADIDSIFTTRDLHSFTVADPIENHLEEATFDSEFFERNGRFIRRRNRFDFQLPDNPPTAVEEALAFADPQGNCMNSLAKLIKL